MTNIILGAVIAAIVALAVRHVYKAKQNGEKCIGCPASKSCSSCNCKK